MSTVEELDLAFKADINGWLESECADKLIHNKLFLGKEKIAPEDDIEPTSLIESLESTLDYFNSTAEAKESLNRVLFRAVLNYEDFEVDFDVPRFEIGVDFRVFHHIIKHFDLYHYLYRELWKLDYQTALDFIIKSCLRFLRPVDYMHTIYIKIWHKSTQSNETEDAGSWLITELRKDLCLNREHLFKIMFTFYECFKENAQRVKYKPELKDIMRYSTSTLFKVAAQIADEVESNKSSEFDSLNFVYSAIYKLIIEEVPITRDNAESFMQLEVQLQQQEQIAVPYLLCNNIRMEKHDSLKYDWERSLGDELSKVLSSHERMFMMICSHLKRRSLTMLGKQAIKEPFFSNLGCLENHIQNSRLQGHHDDNLLNCKLWCCYTLKYCSSNWISVLKVMMQFFDLWISDIDEAKCVDIFVVLAVEENMLSVLFDHILKHVQLYELSKYENPSMTLMNLCKLFLKCLENSKSDIQLVQLRDYMFSKSPFYDSVSPTFGTIAVWNIPFEAKLTKVCNKITSVEDDENMTEILSDKVFKELLVLSLIWPYEVIRQLVLNSFENKNQYKAIVPILNKLGHLRTFGKGVDFHETLLLRVIRDVLFSTKNNLIDLDIHRENIIRFIKSCCSMEFSKGVPFISLPNSLVDQSMSILNPKDILEHLILQSLAHPLVVESEISQETHRFRSVSGIRIGLHLLNAFSEPIKQLQSACNKGDHNWMWANDSDPNERDLPVVLYCSPELFIERLTKFMDLRYKTLLDPSYANYDIRGQDWELALAYIQRFTHIVQHALQQLTISSTIYSKLRNVFENLRKQHDWRLQALWYPLMRSLIDKPLPVTREFIDITGGLNGLFTLANEEDGENSSVSNKGSYDNALLAGWCDVFHTCGLSTGLTDDLFKNTQYSTQWSYNLVSLWTHPSECQIISECFRRVLYPAHSLAVPAEYKNLLQYFLGRLYDSCEFSTIMNNHDDHTIIPFVQKLRNEDTKAYFIVLHVIQLLSVQLKSSTNDAADKHGKYYVANLVKMLQDLTHWGEISKRENQPRSYSALKDLIVKGRFKKERLRKKISKAESNPEEKEPQIALSPSSPPKITEVGTAAAATAAAVAMEPETVYYPLLNTEDSISRRSLSVLTLFHMCSLPTNDDAQVRRRNDAFEVIPSSTAATTAESEGETQQATIFRFIMLILDGLVDMQSRQQFQSLLQTQPKERYNTFKKSLKKTGFGVVMRMRPVFTEEEETLLMPAIKQSYHSQHILQILQSVSLGNPRIRHQKKEELYFY